MRPVLVVVGVALAVPVALVALIIGALVLRDRHAAAENPTRSHAWVLRPYIAASDADLLHTYNRHESVFIREPSYEVYLSVERSPADAAAGLVDTLESAGYRVTSYEKVDRARNEGRPYMVVVGVSGRSDVEAELFDRTLPATSNDDFFGEHAVEDGTTAIAVDFRLLD